jgi:polyhydroxyalkanoate synthesis regulator phasin
MASKQSEAGLLQAVSHSGHEIWLAGMGALCTARREGSKLFELLVEEGRTYAGTLTVGGVQQLRSRVGAGVGTLERLLEKRLARLLESADLPSSRDVGELTRRVAQLDRHVSALTRRSRASHGRKPVKRKIRSQARP